MKIRDRIKALRRVKASELIPHPKNWRTHPESQRDALRGLLAEVGYAGAALARETPEGLVLIDGHLRADLTPETKIPVLVLDVTEEEADKLLATFDPIGAMAGTNAEALKSLLREVNTESDALRQMLDAMAVQAELEVLPTGESAPEGEDKQPEPVAAQKWGFYVDCQDESQQHELMERLRGEGYECRGLTA